MTRALAMAAVLCCTGCFSLFNNPDEDKLFDAAVPDGFVPDGGDAGPGLDGGEDGGGCASSETECGDGLDNDCNGSIDCADWSCAGSMQCCTDSTTTEFDWTVRDALDRWQTMPDSRPVPTVDMGEGRITGFGTSNQPLGIRSRGGCTPLSGGAEITTTLRTELTASCRASTPCFAAIALTGSRTLSPGNRVVPDLVVTLFDDGQLVVTATRERERRMFDAGQEVTVTIRAAPGVVDGVEVLLADVSLETSTSRETVVSGLNFIGASDLDRGETPSDPCVDNPGLYLVIEGLGQGVSVGQVDVTQEQCVNPSQFASPDDDNAILSQSILGFDEWASGWMSAPAFLATPSGSDTRYDVWVEGTDTRRMDEFFTNIGFGLLHATHTSAALWDTPWTTGGNAQQPRFGQCHISCFPSRPTEALCMGMGVSCPMPPAAPRNYREPAIYPVNLGSGELDQFILAAAVQTVAEPPDLYPGGYFGLSVVRNVDRAPTMDTESALMATITTTSLGNGCLSLRQPSIVSRTADLSQGYWLFYVCARSPAEPTEIRAVQLDRDRMLVDGTDQLVIGPDIGDYAAGGVDGPEALIEFRDQAPAGATTNAVIRLWFTARGEGMSRRTLNMAQAELGPGATALTEFLPYPANPILEDTSSVLRCGGDCEILGMAVSRMPQTENTLRFLVARRVNTDEFGLVPLEQFWSDPWLNRR